VKKPVPIYVAIKSSKNPERFKRENLSKQALGKRFGCNLFLYLVELYASETATWEEQVWLHLLEKAAGRRSERERDTHTHTHQCRSSNPN
jgi:hypothetical protein